MFLLQYLNSFLKIIEQTGILSDRIITEPTNKERDELWEIARVFINRIYVIDYERNPNQYELNHLCYYSIVALHWSDMYLNDNRFSIESGRFRRDTIALALCLSTRISYTFDMYNNFFKKFIAPHIFYSFLLWTIRSIRYAQKDIFFNKYSITDSKVAYELFEKIDNQNKKDGGFGYIDMKDVPDIHPLYAIWRDLSKLFINERPPFQFILNYISHPNTPSNFVSLNKIDWVANTSFLKDRISKIAFEDSWPPTNDFLFISHYMILLQNKIIPKDVLSVILSKTGEWLNDVQLNELEKNYLNVVTEYEKNHSIIRIKYVLGKIYRYWTLKFNNDNNKLNNQLKYILQALVEIAKSDILNTDSHYDFIKNINNYWGGGLEDSQ